MDFRLKYKLVNWQVKDDKGREETCGLVAKDEKSAKEDGTKALIQLEMSSHLVQDAVLQKKEGSEWIDVASWPW